MARPRTVMMTLKQIRELARSGKLRYARREVREQVVEKHVRWAKENEMRAQPSFPVGEYLGDLQVSDELLLTLTNINPLVNSIDRVKRGAYVVFADFDFAGDGSFLGLRLEPLREGEPEDDPGVVPIIQPLRLMLDQIRPQAGSGWMFGNSIGGALDLDNLADRVIKPVLETSGLKWKGWHAYRRGLATNLHELGIPDKVIQAILRHEDVKTTQRS
jgi:hypothetical protein